MILMRRDYIAPHLRRGGSESFEKNLKHVRLDPQPQQQSRHSTTSSRTGWCPHLPNRVRICEANQAQVAQMPNCVRFPRRGRLGLRESCELVRLDNL